MNTKLVLLICIDPRNSVVATMTETMVVDSRFIARSNESDIAPAVPKIHSRQLLQIPIVSRFVPYVDSYLKFLPDN